jgi:hypothetical protein
MRESDADLSRMASSLLPAERLQSLRLMRGRIAAGRPATDFLEPAKTLIGDSDNDIRWQAIIVVGESVPSDPQAVWEIVQQYAASPDEDIRDAVATVLLEHLLDADFETYFPRVRERIQSGAAPESDLFANTLARCWFSGPGGDGRQAKVAQLLARGPGRKA